MTLRFKIAFSLLIFITLVLLGGAFYFYRELNRPNSSSSDYTIVEVKSGTINDVGLNLNSKGILRAPLIFSIYSRIANREIYAGYYKLPKNLSPREALDALSSEKYRVYKITIPEGYRTEQIAQKMVNEEIVDYQEFISAAKGKEGKLFPDTYFLSKNSDAKEVVRILNDNFTTRTKDLKITTQDLIVASIVERETAGGDRAIIAAIYKNRLKIKMKLDADPTVQYAKDNISIKNLSEEELLKFKFWRTITSKDYYTVASDYNTYTNEGLPPEPICNPGLKSIEATLNPEQNNYLYFFHVDGEIYPSQTISEHNQKKQKYLY